MCNAAVATLQRLSYLSFVITQCAVGWLVNVVAMLIVRAITTMSRLFMCDYSRDAQRSIAKIVMEHTKEFLSSW